MSKSGRALLMYALITAATPGRSNRHYLLIVRADSATSVIDIAVEVYDELARKIHFMPTVASEINAFTEFKEGEFLMALQMLVNSVTENCLLDLTELIKADKTESQE